ncbi:sulfite exporter TauE/SafE family protein [Acrocarpospora macrocephala]|nr:sulfite exporter TauE/SafE family protein [Acrocarpospora macrocephala]
MVVLAVVAGLVIGFGLGALGSGGSVLSVPALVYLFGMDPYPATTGSLIVVGAGAAAGVLAHRRAGQVDVPAGLTLGLFGIPGSALGSWLSAAVDAQLLLSAYVGLLLVAALALHRFAPATAVAAPSPHPPSWSRTLVIIGTATVIGLVTGFLGVGGGFLTVPVLALVFRLPMPVAVGTSLLVIMINSMVALLARAGQDVNLDWAVLLGFAAASVAGCLGGAHIVSRVSPHRLSRALTLVLVAVACYIGLRSVLVLI